MKTVLEFIEFLSKRKKLWMLPLLIVVLLLGSLMMLAEGSVAAPFIYTLF